MKEPKPVKLPIERIDEALNSASIIVPPGLSREKLRQFILKHASKPKKK